MIRSGVSQRRRAARLEGRRRAEAADESHSAQLSVSRAASVDITRHNSITRAACACVVWRCRSIVNRQSLNLLAGAGPQVLGVSQERKSNTRLVARSAVLCLEIRRVVCVCALCVKSSKRLRGGGSSACTPIDQIISLQPNH